MLPDFGIHLRLESLYTWVVAVGEVVPRASRNRLVMSWRSMTSRQQQQMKLDSLKEVVTSP